MGLFYLRYLKLKLVSLPRRHQALEFLEPDAHELRPLFLFLPGAVRPSSLSTNRYTWIFRAFIPRSS